jgi:iron complex outermembrane receptor protein
LANLSLEELSTIQVATVYGASKHEQKVTEAPSAVSIVTADDVKKFGYRTLADILRGVRGFYVTYDRTYTYIGVRGVNRPGDYGGRVLITVNGHRVNEPIYDQAFNGTEFPLDVDLIERVEVIRGPGSSLYGNNAFFAVVNVITRPGRDLKGAETSAAYGSFDTFSGRLTYGNQFTNGVELMLSGTWLQSEGHDRLYYPEFQDVNGGQAEHLDSDRAPSLWAAMSYKSLSLEAGYVDRRKEIPNAPYGMLFNESPAWQEDKRGFAGLRFDQEFEGGWRLLARCYYDYYRSTLLGPYDGEELDLPGEPVWNKDLGLADWLNAEVQLSKTIREKHLLTLGGDYRHDLNVRQKSFYVSSRLVVAEGGSRNDNFGIYLQDEFSIRTNLILNAGVRYDHFQSFGDTVNPRGALIYSPFEKTTLKGIYGQAFRAPNAYERDYTFPGYLANPNLDPETIRSFELVWEQRIGSRLQLTSGLFYNQMHDLITQVFDEDLDAYIFENTDTVEARGGEIELAGQWQSGLRGSVSYTFVDTREESGDSGWSTSLNSPKHLAKLGLTAPVWRDKMFASLETQAMSGRKATTGSVRGQVVVNLTLFAREIVRGLEASVSVYNLLDERYSDPVTPDFAQASIRQDGRTFRAKLTYRF